MQQRRVMLIANKWWEADPLSWVLFHDKARPPQIKEFVIHNYPAMRSLHESEDPSPMPRFTFRCGNACVEVWCVEELMNPSVSASSTAEKARVLPAAFAKGKAPDLVIAFGTAGSREGLSIAGCVVVGRRVFIHNPYGSEEKDATRWRPPSPDVVIDSPLPRDAFRRAVSEARYSAEARFLAPPVTPASPLRVLAGDGFVSLGVVNITNYDDYIWADRSAVDAFNEKASRTGQIGSIETTHGVIRSMSDAPFLYVSGITDMEGLFDAQVAPREYGQNTVAAHNAGIAAAWLLPGLIASLA
jgi:hypothetical protein